MHSLIASDFHCKILQISNSRANPNPRAAHLFDETMSARQTPPSTDGAACEASTLAQACAEGTWSDPESVAGLLRDFPVRDVLAHVFRHGPKELMRALIPAVNETFALPPADDLPEDPDRAVRFLNEHVQGCCRLLEELSADVAMECLGFCEEVLADLITATPISWYYVCASCRTLGFAKMLATMTIWTPRRVKVFDLQLPTADDGTVRWPDALLKDIIEECGGACSWNKWTRSPLTPARLLVCFGVIEGYFAGLADELPLCRVFDDLLLFYGDASVTVALGRFAVWNRERPSFSCEAREARADFVARLMAQCEKEGRSTYDVATLIIRLRMHVWQLPLGPPA